MDGATVATAIVAFVVPFVIGGLVGLIAGSAHTDRTVRGMMSLKASADWHTQNFAAMARLRKIQLTAIVLGLSVGIVALGLVLANNWSFLPR